MGGLGWAWVTTDGYFLGMGTNSKENVGLCYVVRASCIKLKSYGTYVTLNCKY
jgi:hypothetical protein